MKRIAFLLLASLLLFPSAFAACGMAGDDSQLIFRISAQTDAHAEQWDQGNYLPVAGGVEICYDAIFGPPPYAGANPHDCTGTNTVLKLSAATSADVEQKDQANYSTEVCFGNLECGYAASGGQGSPACASWQPGAECIATISAATSAHVSAVCNGSESYSIAVCCKPALAPNAAPVANAGSDQATLSGASVSLNGSCTDSDGTISDCDWGSAPAGCSFAGVQSKAGLGTANASSAVDASCIGAVGAVFNFSLTATDNFGATGADAMSVTISPVPLPSTLKIIQFNAEPLSFPAPQPAPAPPNEFSTVDVKVKNIGAGSSDVYVKLEVFSLQTGQSLGSVTGSCAAVAPDSLCELGKDDFPGLDVSSLQSGAYKLTATVLDSSGMVHDTKSLFFTVGSPVPVPELSFVLLPLVAFAVIALVLLERKNKK